MTEQQVIDLLFNKTLLRLVALITWPWTVIQLSKSYNISTMSEHDCNSSMYAIDIQIRQFSDTFRLRGFLFWSLITVRWLH